MNTRRVVSSFLVTVVVSLSPGAVPTTESTLGARSLGEWTTDCASGFYLTAMPGAWIFSPRQGPLTVVARVAIDYELLPESDYRIRTDRSGEEYSDLVAYRLMLLEARIRPRGGEVITVLPGTYTIDNGKQPVVFRWDGRDRTGRPVRPGLYEIEVRGRFVPAWTGLTASDGAVYGDFDDWSEVAEACTRVLTIAVRARPLPQAPSGVSCSPPPADYYDSVDSSSSAALRSTLHPVIDDHTRYPYSSTSTDTWDVLNDADENPSDDTELLTIYKNEANADGCSSGCAWNREHTWAKSFGFSEESGNGRIPYTDCHHLRAADPGYNSARNNRPHNTCTSGCSDYPTDENNGFGGATELNHKSGSNITCGNTPNADDVWETWDHRKGDVARSILYLDIRYEGDTGVLGQEQDLVATSDLGLMLVETTTCGDGYQDPAYHGVLSTLITWSNDDPPDADEIRRNDQVWCYQGNRNPFVDHPEWVDCLYLNSCGSNPVFGGITGARDQDLCEATGVLLQWSTPPDWNDGCLESCSRGFRIYRDGTEVASGDCTSPRDAADTSCVDDSGTVDTLYTYRVEAYNNEGGTNDGGTTADAADSSDDATSPVISSGPVATPTADRFTATWDTDEAADSYLEWGTTSGGPYDDSTSLATAETSHSLTAAGLAASTLYYYRVCSADPCGNGPTCSAEQNVTTAAACGGSGTTVFINELHYDNDGDDINEGVEVAGPAGTSLSGWSIEVYNGNGGGLATFASPNPAPLSGSIDDEGSGYGALWFAISSIENGSPDGVALIDDSSSVVQFLCYEGTFLATAGTANGLTCTDIGVAETGSTPVDDALQLTGEGSVYEDFTWSGPDTHSRGSGNAGQTMSCSPPPDPVQHLTATAGDGQVKLEWLNPDTGTYGSTLVRYRTDTYPNGPTDGTQIYASGAAGAGGYDTYSHTGLSNGVTHYYAAFVNNGTGSYAASRTVAARPFDTSGATRWAYSTGAVSLATPGLRPGAIGVGGVFAVANDHRMHGMNPSASGGDWPRTAPFSWVPAAIYGPSQSRPGVVPTSLVSGANQVVFLASVGGRVNAIDAETGSLLWQSESLGAMVQAGVSGMFQAFGGDYDLLFVGTRDATGDNGMVALDPVNGSVAWTFDNGGGSGGIGIINGAASVDYANNRLYFTSRASNGGSSDTVWCLSFNGTSGSKVWSAAVGDIDGAPVRYQGRIYVGTNTSKVYALDAVTGGDLWGGPYSASDGPVKRFVWPEFSDLPRGLFFSTTNSVWKVTDTGTAADDSGSNGWSVVLTTPSTPLVRSSAGSLHVGSGDGNLHHLSLNDGSSLGSTTLGDGAAAVGSPAYDHENGLLYVGSESGVVYAVAP